MTDNENVLLLSSSSSSVRRYNTHHGDDECNNHLVLEYSASASNSNVVNRILISIAIFASIIILVVTNSKKINNNIILNLIERKSSSIRQSDPWYDPIDKVDPNFNDNDIDPITIDSKSKITPNFIFILADDLGYNSLGYDDNDIDFATPFMTKMAKKGIILTNYYSQEVCTPARASLLTGRYPITIGMQYGDVDPSENWGLPLDETLLPEILQEEGYKTYAVGKWNLSLIHISEPTRPY